LRHRGPLAATATAANVAAVAIFKHNLFLATLMLAPAQPSRRPWRTRAPTDTRTTARAAAEHHAASRSTASPGSLFIDRGREQPLP